jgi:hypothetical protein
MANAPPWGRMAIIMDLIWVKREAEYFCARDWTVQITLIRLNKFDFTRRPQSTTTQAIDGNYGDSL